MQDYVHINLVEKNYQQDFSMYASFVATYTKIPRETLVEKKFLELSASPAEMLGNTQPDSKELSDSEKITYKIYYEKYLSNVNNTWVVMIHGFGGDSKTWKYQLAELIRNGYNVLIFDLFGHGKSRSSPTVDYRIEFHALYLNQLLDHLGIDQIVLVGFSYGGLIAQCFIKQFESRVKCLVIQSSFSKKNLTLEITLRAWKELLDFNIESEENVKRVMYYHMLTNLFSNHYIQMNYYLLGMLQENFIKNNNRDTLKKEITHMEEFDSTGYLGQFKIPVILLVGVHDKIISTSMNIEMDSILQNSKRYIYFGKNSSHSINIEIFPHFNEILVRELDHIRNGTFASSKLPCHVHPYFKN